MRVKLRNTFIWNGVRYRTSQDGVEVPDEAILPATAEVWQDGKWQKQDEGMRDEQRQKAQERFKESNERNPAAVTVRPVIGITKEGEPIYAGSAQDVPDLNPALAAQTGTSRSTDPQEGSQGPHTRTGDAGAESGRDPKRSGKKLEL